MSDAFVDESPSAPVDSAVPPSSAGSDFMKSGTLSNAASLSSAELVGSLNLSKRYSRVRIYFLGLAGELAEMY